MPKWFFYIVFFTNDNKMSETLLINDIWVQEFQMLNYCTQIESQNLKSKVLPPWDLFIFSRLLQFHRWSSSVKYRYFKAAAPLVETFNLNVSSVRLNLKLVVLLKENVGNGPLIRDVKGQDQILSVRWAGGLCDRLNDGGGFCTSSSSSFSASFSPSSLPPGLSSSVLLIHRVDASQLCSADSAEPRDLSELICIPVASSNPLSRI